MHSLRLCVSLLQHAEGRALATKLLACQTPAFVSCSPQQPAHGPSNGAFQGKKHPRHTKWHVDLSCISNAMVVTAGAAAGGWPPAHASFHTTAGEPLPPGGSHTVRKSRSSTHSSSRS
jgi:hypothetical protein